MAKNIEINIKGSDGNYEVLYPKVNPDILKIDSSNVQVDATLSEKLGLNDGANMGDILGKLESGVFAQDAPYQVDNNSSTGNMSYQYVAGNGKEWVWIFYNKNPSYVYGKNQLCFGEVLFGESKTINITLNKYSNTTYSRYSPEGVLYHKDIGWYSYGTKHSNDNYSGLRYCIIHSQDGVSWNEITYDNQYISCLEYFNNHFYVGYYDNSGDDSASGGISVFDKNWSRVSGGYLNTITPKYIYANIYTGEVVGIFYNGSMYSNTYYSPDGLNFYSCSTYNISNIGSYLQFSGLPDGGFLIASTAKFWRAKFENYSTTSGNTKRQYTPTVSNIFTVANSGLRSLVELNGIISTITGTGAVSYTEDYGMTWKSTTCPTFNVSGNNVFSLVLNNQIYVFPYDKSPYLTSSDGITYTTTHTEYKRFLLDALSNKLKIPGEQILNSEEFAKVETGSYTGTGNYGQSSSCSLTFSFVPSLLIISSNNNQRYNSGYIVCAIGGKSGDNQPIVASVEGSTVTWYNTSGALYQLNASQTYNYVCIG